MSGYQIDFSKSNNAVAAEAAGRFPASILAKRLGVKTGAVRALLRPCEWHHTSKHFNSTDYYDEDTAREMLDQLRAWQPLAKNVTVFENCSGSYLEWSGTRNHPKAREIPFAGIRVLQKGDWFTLSLPSGMMRKGKDTRGFVLRDGQGKRLTFN